MFKKATKEACYVNMAMAAPSGGGKSYSGLRLLTGMMKPGERFAVICTERGSIAKYSDYFDFDMVSLTDHSIPSYIKAIKAAADAGYNGLLIDSGSHAWAWLLDHVDKLGNSKYRGNSFRAWGEGTPLYESFINAMLDFPGHLILTMRTKSDYVMEENSKGKSAPKKVGTKSKQREDIEYEFDFFLKLTIDHYGEFEKTRDVSLDGLVVHKPDEALGKRLMEWATVNRKVEPELTPPPSEELHPDLVAAITYEFDAFQLTPEQVAKTLGGYGCQTIKELSEPQAGELIDRMNAKKQSA